jgi:hypothetical protein
LKSNYRLFSADENELYEQENDLQRRSKDMKTFILMCTALTIIVFLTYRLSGRTKGKPLFQPNLWVFYLIERIFGENDSTKEVMRDDVSRPNPG